MSLFFKEGLITFFSSSFFFPSLISLLVFFYRDITFIDLFEFRVEKFFQLGWETTTICKTFLFREGELSLGPRLADANEHVSLFVGVHVRIYP